MKEENDNIISCPECGSIRLQEDSSTGELICRDCGTVVEEERVKESAERRAFTAEERERKERTGSPLTFTKPGRGMKT